VALRTLGDREEAADAVQDALLSAYRSAGSYRGDARVTTWLHRIVVNACLDRVRRRRARPVVPLPEQGSGAEPADRHDALAARETALDVESALALLTVEQRTAILLVDVHGLPVEEAAAVLAVPVGTVKSRCSRGRARLALSLGHLRNRPDPAASHQRSPSGAAAGGPGSSGPATSSRPAPSSSTAPTRPARPDERRPDRRRPDQGGADVSTPSPHLDLDALADALAGEGSPADAGHLAGCGACAARLGELRAADAVVLDRLAGLTHPPVPADVAARLDGALAAQDPLAQQPPAQERPASVTALPARRSRALPSWLPAAAAAVLVIGGAGAVVSQLGGSTSGGSDSSASSAEGARPAAESAEGGTTEPLLTASGADWADPQAPGTALPRVLGGQAEVLSFVEGSDSSARASAAAEEQDAPAAAAAPLPDQLSRLRTRTAWTPACPPCWTGRTRASSRWPSTTRAMTGSPRWPSCCPTRSPPGPPSTWSGRTAARPTRTCECSSAHPCPSRGRQGRPARAALFCGCQ
jgi:RNA polymerase sigma-70 factor (ECF subfamily)